MLVLLATGKPVQAQDPAIAPVLKVPDDPVRVPERVQARDARQPAVIDDDRKAALLVFANEHQPGVARLLNVLERRNPQEYQRALESLDRDVRRLENLKKRNADLYELGLKRWKNSSAIELLLANIALFSERSDEQTRQGQMRRLRQLVVAREELRAQQLTMDIGQLQGHMERLEKQLAASETDRRQTVEKSMTNLMNRAKRMRLNSTKPPSQDGKSGGDGGGEQ